MLCALKSTIHSHTVTNTAIHNKCVDDWIIKFMKYYSGLKRKSFNLQFEKEKNKIEPVTH